MKRTKMKSKQFTYLFFFIVVFSSHTVKGQEVAINFANAYNAGATFGTYTKNTKVSKLVVENKHDTRAIMCTYVIQDKEYGYSDQIKSETGHTEKIYPGEIFVAYKGSVYKFIYIKKAWFAKE